MTYIPDADAESAAEGYTLDIGRPNAGGVVSVAARMAEETHVRVEVPVGALLAALLPFEHLDFLHSLLNVNSDDDDTLEAYGVPRGTADAIYATICAAIDASKAESASPYVPDFVEYL